MKQRKKVFFFFFFQVCRFSRFSVTILEPSRHLISAAVVQTTESWRRETKERSPRGRVLSPSALSLLLLFLRAAAAARRNHAALELARKLGEPAVLRRDGGGVPGPARVHARVL